MARIPVGGTATVDQLGKVATPGASAVLYLTRLGGTPIADVIDEAGAAIPGGIITIPADGIFPLVRPEVGALTAVWVSVNGGPRQWLPAHDSVAAIADTERGIPNVVYVAAGGDDSKNGLTWSTAKATIQAALAVAGATPTVINLGPGAFDAGSGITVPSGAKVSIIGSGTGLTTIKATGQTKPVLDCGGMSGYSMSNQRIGGFTILGDGTAGAAKSGLKLSGTKSLTMAHIFDIVTKDTGGPGIDAGMTELCDFDRCTIHPPVNAAAADIPWFIGTGAFNGNTIQSLLLNSSTGGTNVGPSGAVVLKDSGGYAPRTNKLADLRIENLHVPTGGTCVHIAGNDNAVQDLQIFDSSKEEGASGTSVVRFAVASSQNFGGNRVRGFIPGRNDPITGFDYGVDVYQDNNFIDGVKGFDGYNVRINPGVKGTIVTLAGRYSGTGSITPAAIDNSGNSTNYVSDYNTRNNVHFNGGYRRIDPGGGRLYGPDAHTPGSAAVVADRVYVSPFWVPESMTVISMHCKVDAAVSGASVRLGVYDANSLDRPGALVLDAGTVDAGTTGAKSITGLSLNLAPGLYWLAACATGGAPTMTTLGAGSLPPCTTNSVGMAANSCWATSPGSGALPASVAVGGYATQGVKVMVGA